MQSFFLKKKGGVNIVFSKTECQRGILVGGKMIVGQAIDTCNDDQILDLGIFKQVREESKILLEN